MLYMYMHEQRNMRVFLQNSWHGLQLCGCWFQQNLNYSKRNRLRNSIQIHFGKEITLFSSK
jgi:hypothetical protein